MSINNLQELFQEATVNKSLRLPADIGFVEGAAALINQHIPEKEIQIENAQFRSAGDDLIVSGTSNLFSATTEVEARFFYQDDQVQMSLHARLPKDWMMTDSFAALNPKTARALTIADSEFILNTSANGLAQGLNFQTRLQLDGPARHLQPLLSSGKELTLSGPFAVIDQLPSFRLGGPALDQVISLGELHISFDLSLNFEVTNLEGHTFVLPGLQLRTTIQFNVADKTITIPLSANFWVNNTGLVSFVADLENSGIFTLSDLAGLVGDVDPASFLPDELPLGEIGITSLTFDIDLSKKQLYSISLRAGVNKKWTITDKTSLQDVSFSLVILEPASKQDRIIYSMVHGQLTLGGSTRLNLSASFPDFTFSGQLPEQDTLQFGILLKEFFPDADDLPAELTEIKFARLGIAVNPKEKYFSFYGTASAPNWTIIKDILAVNSLSASLLVSKAGSKLITSGFVEGELDFLGSLSFLRGAFGPGQFELRAEIPEMKLKSIISRLAGDAPLPDQAPDLQLKESLLIVNPSTGAFSLKTTSPDVWTLPVGINELGLGQIVLEVDRIVSGSGKSISGTIRGVVQIGTLQLTVAYQFPGNLVLKGILPSISLSPLLQELCGATVIQDIPLPPSILSTELKDLSFEIDPQQKLIKIAADSLLGKVDITVKKIQHKGWGFSCSFIPPSNWKFSSIAPELGVLDGINFNGSSLVLSSSDDRNFALAQIDDPVSIEKGLNFIGVMDMKGTGVDSLIGLEELVVKAAIGGNPANMTLEAEINGEFPIGEGFVFGDVRFRLTPSPANFSIMLLGAITAQVGPNHLIFTGGIEVTPRSASFAATMEGRWKNPFGIEGFAIADVALEVGVTFPPPLPLFGITGKLEIGSFYGLVAVKINAAMPSKSMLAIAFNRLFLMDILKAFCTPAIADFIPKPVQDTVLNIGFENVNISIVPQATRIGEIEFEQGVTLAAKCTFWGLKASVYIKIDFTSGLIVKGDVDPIDIAGIFKLEGVAGKPKASMHIEIAPNKIPFIDISGSVTILFLTLETQIKLSEAGFFFKIKGTIFNLFEASLEVSGTDLQNGGNYYIKAEMRNNFFKYVRENASKAIKAAAEAAIAGIENAQREVSSAKNEVARLNSLIASTKIQIQSERNRDISNLRNAQNEVDKAKLKVDTLNVEITRQRRIVQSERDRDARNLRNAQNEVGKAQNEVNKLQNDINNLHNTINRRAREISYWQNWYNNLPWYEQTYQWARLAAEVAWRSGEITASYAAIGAVEAAKHTALGVLEISKQALRGMEAAAVTIPIDMDPRVSALIAGRDIANGVLELAKLSLRGMEEAARHIPIDMDPRIFSLKAILIAANTALDIANGVLEVSKATVKGMEAVAQAVVKAALGGIIDITYARFEGYLAAADGGFVEMEFHLLFLEQPVDIQIRFNFNDPMASVLELAKKILPV